MLKFTLDTNCIIAVNDQRSDVQAIRQLADAHRDGRADVALVAISASERQRDGAMLDNYTKFEERLRSLNLAHLEILLPMDYSDVMFWDACVCADQNMADFEAKIQAILFPNVPVSWAKYCQNQGLDPDDLVIDKKWKNAKCDVQAFWCHAHNTRDVFVTSDKNFHSEVKKKSLLDLAGGRIELPDAAALLVS